MFFGEAQLNGAIRDAACYEEVLTNSATAASATPVGSALIAAQSATSRAGATASNAQATATNTSNAAVRHHSGHKALVRAGGLTVLFMRAS